MLYANTIEIQRKQRELVERKSALAAELQYASSDAEEEDDDLSPPPPPPLTEGHGRTSRSMSLPAEVSVFPVV